MSDAPPKSTLPGKGVHGGHDTLVGRTLAGRFLIRRPLARGGMGQLYEAEQMPLGRVCALKVLDATQRGPSFARRFFLEASLASKLKHPNTVTVFDYGQCEDGICYIAMELLEGRTLRQVLASEGPFEELRAVRVARQIARSVREAHGAGIVHRDLKPANVMLIEPSEGGDFVKVLDFGLAKPIGPEGEDLTASGQFVGTPKYMAPEQIEGRPVGPSVDIYALGVLLYEMAAGRPPFEGESSIHVLIAHLTQKPRALETVSKVYAGVVERALAKSPGDRFGSIDELLEALVPLDRPSMSSLAPALVEVRMPSVLLGRPSGSTPGMGWGGLEARPSLAEPAHDGALGAAPSPTASPPLRARVARWRRGALVALGGAMGLATLVGVSTASRQRQAQSRGDAADAPAAEVVASLSGGPALAISATEAVPGPPASIGGAGAPSDGRASAVEAAEDDLVRVESLPRGAEVRAGGREGAELCASTPCDVSRASVASAGGHVYLTRRGYVSTQHDILRAERQVVVRLRPTQASAPTLPSALPGYKPAPY